MNNCVIVMMSTYNGEKYLREQINSILAQTNVEVQLYVRDDGSSDGTVDILREYENANTNVHVTYGENLGYIKSFMWLVYHVPAGKGYYYCFADQDDVWLPEKLEMAVQKIRNASSDAENEVLPVAYYSDLNVVDANETFIRRANDWEGRINKYMISVFIGIRGCTMVFNDALHTKLLKYEPKRISGHDTYVAMLAFWTGTVVYDENAYINYRQTGENVSITGVNRWDKLKKNFLYMKKRMTNRANIHEMNAKEIYCGYSDEIVQREKLQKVVEYKRSLRNKLALIFDKDFNQFSMQIRLFNVIFILMGKL